MVGSYNPNHAVYAGSFDPITLGHQDIIQRGARMFGKLTVAVGINPDKRPLFDPEERVSLISEILKPVTNVEVTSFTGLTVNFVKECGAGVMLRGIRTLTDIDAEFTMSLANHTLAPEIETVFLMSGEKYTHISSSLIKQIALLGGEANMSRLQKFVPEPVIAPLLEKFKNR